MQNRCFTLQDTCCCVLFCSVVSPDKRNVMQARTAGSLSAGATAWNDKRCWTLLCGLLSAQNNHGWPVQQSYSWTCPTGIHQYIYSIKHHLFSPPLLLFSSFCAEGTVVHFIPQTACLSILSLKDWHLLTPLVRKSKHWVRSCLCQRGQVLSFACSHGPCFCPKCFFMLILKFRSLN